MLSYFFQSIDTPEDDAASDGWYQKGNRPTYGTVLDPSKCSIIILNNILDLLDS